MKQFAQMSLEELIRPEGHACSCGRTHKTGLGALRIGEGAVDALPDFLQRCGVKRPFIISDRNTRAAAWPLVAPVLSKAGIPYAEYVYTREHVEPDEMALGSLAMAFDPSCDGILVIGSGVLNDVGKVFARATGLPSLVVATAPSMDGYASDSAAMIRDKVKVTIYTACPGAVIADTRVVKEAPMRMLQAGLGDMLAKYLSVCEWRVSNLVTGEYYCENIAGLMRASLQKIVDNIEGLKRRDGKAVDSVMEGLVLSGIAMAFAGISRPASGLEHYFSHIWEMMALERGAKAELHGIQVGIGTLLSLGIWEDIARLQPDREKALRFINDFDEAAWEGMIRRVFGSAAEAVLKAARAEGRNDRQAHSERLERTLGHWEDILQVAREELPPLETVADMMRFMDMPMKPEDIGFSRRDTHDALLGAREIRNKYLASSLLWDLGELYTLPFPKPEA